MPHLITTSLGHIIISMGIAIFIDLEQEIPGFDPFVNGKAVASEAEALNRALESLGHRSLFELLTITEDEVAFMNSESEDDEPVPVIPDEAWHGATEGVEIFQALSHYVQQNPGDFEDPEFLREELDDFVRILSKATQHKVRWRLLPDL